MNFNFIQQKSPTSISGEMNANEAYNSAGVQTHAEWEKFSSISPC